MGSNREKRNQKKKKQDEKFKISCNRKRDFNIFNYKIKIIIIILILLNNWTMGKNNIAAPSRKATGNKPAVMTKHAKNNDTCLNDSIVISSGNSKLNALFPYESSNAGNDRMVVEEKNMGKQVKIEKKGDNKNEVVV